MNFNMLFAGRLLPFLHTILRTFRSAITGINPTLKKKIIMRINLTGIILLAALLQVSAISRAQKITINQKNVAVEHLFKLIKEQSGYNFIYTGSLLQQTQPTTVKLAGASIQQAMDACLKDQPLSYTIEDNTIIIKEKETPILTKLKDITVSGRVVDTAGTPLPGASITVKGKAGHDRVSITPATGIFSVSAQPGEVITVSFIGYESYSLKVTEGLPYLSIVLHAKSNMIENEVIVVAYGTSKKEALTGAVATINRASLTSRPLTNINNALQGAAPGIQVTTGSGQPGSTGSVRIRGIGSINASSEPLYVVDGAVYDLSIANLNVNDIDNISILKDASASALYGSRAANGVVIITTIKGKKGLDQLNINVTQGVSSRSVPEYSRVDAYQYYPLAWQAYKNSLVYPTSGTGASASAAATTASGAIKGLLGYNPFNVADNNIVGTDGKLNPEANLLYNDFDWYAPLKRTGKRTDANLNYSGASEKSDYFLSLGYLNDKGYVLKSDYDRFTARLNLNAKPTKWFKTGVNLSGTITKSNQASTGRDNNGASSYNNIFFFARNIGPIYPVYTHDASGAFVLDASGDKVYDLGAARPAGASPGRHVVEETLLNDNLYKRNVLSARTYGEISFLKDFKFTPSANVDISNYDASTYDNKIVGDGAPAGRATVSASTTTSYTINQILSYNKTIGKHGISVIAGHENYQYQYKYLVGSRNTQILDGNTELANFTTTSNLNSYTDVYKLESYFSQANYNYDGKYFLNGGYRTDGSSKFSKQNRWGNFFSVGAAWLASSESFLSNVSWLNYLKLRTSYGSVGNDKLQDQDGYETYYNYQSFYNLNNNNASEAGLLLSTLPTPNLKWETNYSTDIAVEYAMFKNRLRGTVEVFNRKSGNLLFAVPLPVSAGVATIARNIGSMYNKGIEIQIGGDIIRSKNFKWDATLNWSVIQNKITKMPAESPTIVDGTKKLEVGHSIYDYWLRQWGGVDPSDGSSLYVRNKDIAVSNTSQNRTINGVDYTTNANNALLGYSGSAIPKYFGSFNSNFTYKNFSFGFLINYSVGGKVYDSSYQSLMSYSSYGGALHVDALKSWQNPGDVTNVPRLDVGSSANNNTTSNRFLIDASYLSFRQASLSYTLPKSWISNIDVRNARIYMSGENLGLISRRKGMDPTYSYTGVTSNSYSPTRIVSIGLNVGF
jgi:TonB-linked SusC/RagA family outer membrane protein